MKTLIHKYTNKTLKVTGLIFIAKKLDRYTDSPFPLKEEGVYPITDFFRKKLINPMIAKYPDIENNIKLEYELLDTIDDYDDVNVYVEIISEKYQLDTTFMYDFVSVISDEFNNLPKSRIELAISR